MTRRLLRAARALAHAEVRQALSLSAAALDSTADGIIVVDRTGKITLRNRRFVEMWRIPKAIADSGDDKRALAFVLDQLKDPDAFLARVRELYLKASEESFDVIEFKDGRVFERYSRPQTLDGEVVGRVWSFRDATERRQLERAIAEAAGREQERLARELHDTIGQTLTAISLAAGAAAAKSARRRGDPAEFGRIAALAQTALAQTRNVARGLLPPELHEGDLAGALDSLADLARELFGVRCTVAARGRTRLDDPVAAFELYRIAQEATFNAAKHARSKTGVAIALTGGASELVLRVVDEGAGLPKRAADGKGLGLAIMRHRAELLGGRLEIKRRPSGGTEVVCRCPRPRKTRRRR